MAKGWTNCHWQILLDQFFSNKMPFSYMFKCQVDIKLLGNSYCCKDIIGRMGIPYRAKARPVNIISIALDAPQNTISALSGKIGKLAGVSVKTAYSGVIQDAE